jgi:hypothetical protein
VPQTPFILFMALVACAATELSEPPAAPSPPAEAAAQAPAQAPTAAQAAPAAKPAEALRPVEIEAIAPPAAPSPMPRVTITAPRSDQVIPADQAASFAVKLEVKDWPVQEAARHVHLILDDQPYLAVFEPKASIPLRDVAPGANLGEGQHVLVAFPSRENHVSVKPEGGKTPAAVISFWVGKKGAPAWKATDPTLVYSRPKGEYVGPDADNVILDFYLLNAELGPGKFMVHPTITPPSGESRSITVSTWQPFLLKNLPDGETRVKLELRDKDGVVVPGPWNSVERTIMVRRSNATASR